MKKSLLLIPLLSMLLLIPANSQATAQPSVTSSSRSVPLYVDAYCVQANKCRRLGVYVFSSNTRIVSRVCVSGKCQKGKRPTFSSKFRLNRSVSTGQALAITVTVRSKKSGKKTTKTVIDRVRRVNQ